MYMTFIVPARSRMGRLGITGEVHFSHEDDVVERLSKDALAPLSGLEKVGTAEVEDDDANTLARMFGENGWWVCWCDE